jgi:hypothetical protein
MAATMASRGPDGHGAYNNMLWQLGVLELWLQRHGITA